MSFPLKPTVSYRRALFTRLCLPVASAPEQGFPDPGRGARDERVDDGVGVWRGYVAQGGDIGSMVARVMAAEYDGCKGIHPAVKQIS